MCGLLRALPDHGRAGSLYRLCPRVPAPWQDVGVPSPAPTALPRRTFLAVSTGAVGLVVTSACSVPDTHKAPDAVLELIRAAERDALEFGAADASHGTYVDTLRRLADIRRIHAERLSELIEQPAGTAETGAAVPTSDAGPPVTCPPVDEVRTRLRTDASHAGEVAVGSVGVRAELTGSVSAACTAALEVLLP